MSLCDTLDVKWLWTANFLHYKYTQERLEQGSLPWLNHRIWSWKSRATGRLQKLAQSLRFFYHPSRWPHDWNQHQTTSSRPTICDCPSSEINCYSFGGSTSLSSLVLSRKWARIYNDYWSSYQQSPFPTFSTSEKIGNKNGGFHKWWVPKNGWLQWKRLLEWIIHGYSHDLGNLQMAGL